MSTTDSEGVTTLDESSVPLIRTFLDSLRHEKSVDIDETAKLLETLSPKKLESKGLAVTNLIVGSMRTGFGGKTILELIPDPAIFSQDNQRIDSGSIRIGDNVKIESSAKAASSKTKLKQDTNTQLDYIEGVVTKVTNKLISVAVDEKHESSAASLDGRVWIAQLSNPATYKRMEYALKDLDKSINSNPSHLVEVLLGNAEPRTALLTSEPDIIDKSLNPPQVEAVKFSLDNELSVIHGPPGTGKTYTLIEIIRQLVAKGERVLVCGPSNISVDNILERLHGHIKGDKLLRLGHPARLLQSNLIHSVEIVSKNSDRGQIVRDIREEIDQNFRKITKTRNGKEKKAIYSEVKELRREYRVREKAVVSNLILEAQVIVCTLHGAGSRSVREAIRASNPDLFDTIIIDEVSQSLEPQCWIPIMMCPTAKRLIVAGDNQQLPPTVKTKDARNKDILETTIFDRLVKLYGDKIKKLLSIQYRMNTPIMSFPSMQMYGNKLVADKSVADRLLSGLPDLNERNESADLDISLLDSAVVWLDTQGGAFNESVPSDTDSAKKSDINQSRLNTNEAYLTRNYVEKLLALGLRQSHIGIISPYSAQVTLLKSLLSPTYPDIEISTVDGFQGREKEAIIMSLVRSNEQKEIGFLSEERRTNVAITRPRRHLCVIGDMETIAVTRFLKNWVNWAEDNADLEYPDVSEL
ncbi:ATP-dependent 5'-3' DNA helicase HCS1 [Sugiyamaella lignohabitans]|uniref:DNA helicase n=1 Tax=Sugiyamaella lignohabitans TaxID=796027 RepID=A0A167FYS7_9ASCO|nr:ATP-dependent 5'-3' DNA helicase HCS1 [Sugiyamaella lignohabitans]ANB15876.1 ATP-dependent 5'-3' DNA helicase HCS1 [Sugiyamaella lignohabitans]